MYISLLETIARSLETHHISYMVIGGQAVLMYGEPRLTRDIDITIDVTPERYEEIVQVCKECSLEIELSDVRSFVRDTYVLPCEHRVTGFSVKFIFSDSAYEKEALARAQEVKIRERYVLYASAEDVVIHKILAARAKDYEDIRSIIHKQKNLSNEYILNVLKEFDEALHTGYVKIYQNIWADSTEL